MDRTRKEDARETFTDPMNETWRTADEHRRTPPEEREIDQILADSFPASDAPPWTLGVTSTAQREAEARALRRHR